MKAAPSGNYEATIAAKEIFPQWDFMYYLEVRSKGDVGAIWPSWTEGEPYVVVKLDRSSSPAPHRRSGPLAAISTDKPAGIEAEETIPIALWDDWLVRSTLSGHSGKGYLVAPPDQSDNHRAVEYEGASPMVKAPIEFKTAGTYRVWIRVLSARGLDGDVSVGFGDTQPPKQAVFNLKPSSEWRWEGNNHDGKPLVIKVDKPGTRDLVVWLRSGDVALDRLFISANQDAMPE